MGTHDLELARWKTLVPELATAYRNIPAGQRTESIGSGWSARQVLQHLLEDEILFSTRMRAAVADPGSVILPFDAERYQTNLSYAQVPDDTLLDAPILLRSINIGLLRSLPACAWAQTVRHPEVGTQSVEEIATMFGDHVAEHLKDLQNACPGSAIR